MGVGKQVQQCASTTVCNFICTHARDDYASQGGLHFINLCNAFSFERCRPSQSIQFGGLDFPKV